uniref:Spermatogenesis-associated protein 13 n=1 Tax=Parascaris univalens TaxID=6257 RepID=A0A915A9K8_PARUN
MAKSVICDLSYDFVSPNISSRSYDPIIVAAAQQQNLTFMLPPSNYQSSANAYIRKRSSLVEALNNSIFPPSPDVEKHRRSVDICSTMDYENHYVNSGYEPYRIDRVYSIKHFLRKVNNDYDCFGGTIPVDEQQFSPLELPSRLVQTRTQNTREKRSKSQPIHSPIHIDSDEEFDGPTNHMSRVDAIAFYNASGDSEGSSAKDRTYRSSVHSTTSSMTTSSTVSSSDEQGLMTVEAAWDHVAILPDELPFAAGDVINVLDYSSHSELWYGSCRDRTGWFPSSHVRVVNRSMMTRASTSDDFPQAMRILRAKVIQELMSTERDYVDLLKNLVKGFIEQTRRRTEMFSPSRILRIFGNLEAIYALHCKFLRELELAYNQNAPENSCVGTAFLRNRSSFSIYSEYCNNRPVSCAELAALSEKSHYHEFFEACRLLRGMPKLSLEGFLLTPVQRICRYPLQLAELLKATPVSHLDREPVQAAATAMKTVAALINEKKRRLESLQKIALWQRNVEGWRGPDLVETNCRMVHSGEVSCRCVTDGSILWHKDVLLFLFDQSLIICKKDIIKKNHYLFRDRISLNSATFVDCPDGKDISYGITLRNSWKLVTTGKELIFSSRDKASKNEWAEHMRRRIASSPPTQDERRLVHDTLSRASHGKLDMSTLLDGKTRFSWKKNKY